MVDDLTEEEASDDKLIAMKLNEIDAKLNAIKDAMEADDVVVKSWFETE